MSRTKRPNRQVTKRQVKRTENLKLRSLLYGDPKVGQTDIATRDIMLGGAASRGYGDGRAK